MMLRKALLTRLAAGVAASTVAVAFALCGGQSAAAIPTALQQYVRRPDPAFAWQIRARAERSQGRLWDIDLTSQKWHGIVWEHALVVFEPPKVRFPRHVLLFITGGSNGGRPGKDSLRLGFRLAELTGARVAVLHQVPNQPLLGNHKEDDLITETWLRYLATGDVTWVLQLPMVKSAVRAMDAVEALTKKEWNGSATRFVVTGASKRGWTTWLTAVVDRRVVGIAPMVIDMLNVRPQMKYQLETWGAYSEQIADYTRKGLVHEGDLSPRETALLRLVDPYTYRSQLTLPKLLIHGTNDPYWTVDAAKFYWDDLQGEKSLHEVPNAGHGLNGGRGSTLPTLAAFFHHVAGSAPWPKLQWTHGDDQRELSLQVTSSPQPKAARLWTAHSPTKDFRKAKWRSEPLVASNGRLVAKVAKPQGDHVAFFGELEFDDEGTAYSLCTLVRRY